MASITTRETAGGGATVKGSPLTNAELDANFININLGITSSAAITGGTINGTTIGSTTPAAGNFTETVITASGSTAALTITNTGTGNSLLVEDSANPDSSPFVIDASGLVGIGTTSPAAKLEVLGTSSIFRDSATASANSNARILGGAYTGNPFTLVVGVGSSGNNALRFGGGTTAGEPATSIGFYTGTAGTANAGTEVMRIDASGNVGIGNTPSGTYKLEVTGAGYFSSDLTVAGNLTINGTTTNINTTNLVVEDKNIIIGDVTTPNDATTADGGGITLKGTSDKTFNWVNSTSAWTSSEHLDLASGKAYYINGTSVLSGSTLGSGVTASSLTSVGTLTSIATSGNLSLTTASRIYGAFNEGVLSDYTAFQNSTTNSATTVYAFPNGTSSAAGFAVATGTTNPSTGYLQINNSGLDIISSRSGSGSYLPIRFYLSGGEKLRISAAGGVFIGSAGTDPGAGNLQVTGNIISNTHIGSTAASNTMTIQSTSANSLTDSIVFKTGNNGANSPLTINNASNSPNLTVAADLLFTDATYDIGKSGATRPRDLFLSRNLVAGGTATAGSFIPTSSTAPTNGMYLSGTNTLSFSTNSQVNCTIDSSGDMWNIVNSSLTSGSYKFGDATTAYATITGVYSSATSGYLSFSTLNTSLTERMRITVQGAVSFGSSGTAYGTTGQKLISAGANASPVWTSTGAVSVFTTGTAATYTAPAGTTMVKVTVVGGGGAGGAAASQRGSGGGAGGVAIKWLTMLAGQTLTYTVGAAGAASSVSSGTLTITTITCNGGSAGAAAAYSTAGVGPAGGAGGSATGGDININGQAGGYAFSYTTTVASAMSGFGGTSGNGMGIGGATVGGAAVAGQAGTGYGSGGGGAVNSATAGAGAAGVVIFEAF